MIATSGGLLQLSLVDFKHKALCEWGYLDHLVLLKIYKPGMALQHETAGIFLKVVNSLAAFVSVVKSSYDGRG